MLFHLSKQFSQKHLKRIYLALYEPILKFGILHWGSTFDSLVHPIIVLQKKAIRAIADIKPREHSAPWFTKLELLPFDKLCELEKITFMRRYIKRFSEAIRLNSTSRLSQDTIRVTVPNWKKEVSRRQSPFSAALAFNAIPLKIRRINSHSTFREHVKSKVLLHVPAT